MPSGRPRICPTSEREFRYQIHMLANAKSAMERIFAANLRPRRE
jgi:hypothetical protein